MALIWPKDWREFQHYKGRNPPWVKLQRKILDDYEFHCLHDASKALAPCLWLLASEHEDGHIELNLDRICFRLRMDTDKLRECIIELIEKDFFECDDDASAMLAPCKHDAIPEVEVDTNNQQTDTPPCVPPQGGKPAKGTRIPDDWEAGPKERAFAKEMGLNDAQIAFEAAKFADHWRQSSSKNAVKRDWLAGWRNWLRSDYRSTGPPRLAVDNDRAAHDRREMLRGAGMLGGDDVASG